MHLPSHQLKLVLVEPEIPQNTGNIARLCAVTGAELHLVKPLGFFLSGRHLKRSGMDYLDRVKLVIHEDLPALQRAMAGQRYWLTSAHGETSFWDARYQAGDWLILGRETSGLPSAWTQAEKDRTLRIPLQPHERCLNIATAAGVVLFEVLRQLHYK